MYIELHCHSAFSFLDGASLPEQLALTASQLGYPALALTDHNGLYGSMAFAQEAKQLGLQAITGAELTLLDGSHVTLLAETPEGYANLCRLITEAHLGRADRRDPRLDFASLEARHAGLIVLSGCRNGLLPGVLGRDAPPAARRFAERCRAVFGKGTVAAPRQHDEPRVPGFERGKVEPRVAPICTAEMSLRNQPAEVRVPFRRLREQRHMRPVEQGQLRAGDRLETELFRFLCERHRAVQPVVVGERERWVAELRRGERELLGERGAVEK